MVGGLAAPGFRGGAPANMGEVGYLLGTCILFVGDWD